MLTWAGSSGKGLSVLGTAEIMEVVLQHRDSSWQVITTQHTGCLVVHQP